MGVWGKVKKKNKNKNKNKKWVPCILHENIENIKNIEKYHVLFTFV